MESVDISRIWPQWRTVELIGKGSYGRVYRIEKDEYGITTSSALKVMEIPQGEEEIAQLRESGMDEASIRSFLSRKLELVSAEIRNMIALKAAPNVVKIEDFYIDAHRNGMSWTIYIRMELLTSLPDYVRSYGPLPENFVIRLGESICSALIYCEKKNILHRDIKPSNVFVDSLGNFKLGDFGIARQLESAAASVHSMRGTSKYMAPEVVRGDKYNGSVDIYSLGIMMYRYLNHGRYPLEPPAPKPLTPEDTQNALSRRLAGEKFPGPDGCSSRTLSRTVMKACQADPRRRYQDASQMLKDLKKAEQESGAAIGNYSPAARSALATYRNDYSGGQGFSQPYGTNSGSGSYQNYGSGTGLSYQNYGSGTGNSYQNYGSGTGSSYQNYGSRTGSSYQNYGSGSSYGQNAGLNQGNGSSLGTWLAEDKKNKGIVILIMAFLVGGVAFGILGVSKSVRDNMGSNSGNVRTGPDVTAGNKESETIKLAAAEPETEQKPTAAEPAAETIPKPQTEEKPDLSETESKPAAEALSGAKYTIRFDPNGGKGQMPDQHVSKKAEEFRLDENTYTMSGKYFRGWSYMDPEEYGITEQDAAPIYDEELMPAWMMTDIYADDMKKDTLTLYALWGRTSPDEISEGLDVTQLVQDSDDEFWYDYYVIKNNHSRDVLVNVEENYLDSHGSVIGMADFSGLYIPADDFRIIRVMDDQALPGTQVARRDYRIVGEYAGPDYVESVDSSRLSLKKKSSDGGSVTYEVENNSSKDVQAWVFLLNQSDTGRLLGVADEWLDIQAGGKATITYDEYSGPAPKKILAGFAAVYYQN